MNTLINFGVGMGLNYFMVHIEKHLVHEELTLIGIAVPIVTIVISFCKNNTMQGHVLITDSHE